MMLRLLRCGPPAMLACSAWACAAGVAAAPAGVAEAAGEVAEAGAVEDLELTSETKTTGRPLLFFFWGGALPLHIWTCSSAEECMVGFVNFNGDPKMLCRMFKCIEIV